jgi:hypothetical protein
MDIMEAVIMVVEDIMEVEGAGLLVMGAAEDGEGETAVGEGVEVGMVGEVVELDWRTGGREFNGNHGLYYTDRAIRILMP